jgi:hypothetical protein
MPNWEKDAFDDVDFRGIVKERGTPMSLTNNVDIVASKTIILPACDFDHAPQSTELQKKKAITCEMFLK